MRIDSAFTTIASGIATFLMSAVSLASEPGATVRFSGSVLSATGKLPQKISAFADCADDRPRIRGKVEHGTYLIDLPVGVACSIHVGEYEWDAQPISVADAVHTAGRPALLYPRAIPEPAIARELLQMKEQDQADRTLIVPGSAPDVVANVASRDSARRQRLEKIIAAKGWPTAPMVGWEAADAAWLIAQHADDAPAFQRRALALLEEESNKQGMPIDANIAYLADRIAVREHRPQHYGTQLATPAPGKPCDIDFLPLDDRKRVDERRRAIGLAPLDVYRQQFLTHGACNEPGADPG